MICTWERLRKIRLIASVVLERSDDMRLGKIEEVQIERICFVLR